MSAFEVLETDVLIVGSEAGGARAAIEAHKGGARVIVCTKSLRGRSGVTLKAVFSVAAAFGFADPRDNPEVHFNDTVVGGRYLCNQKLTKVYAEEGPERLDELGKWGVPWDKAPDGRYRQVKLYGHTYPRSLSVGYHVGVAWIQCYKRLLNKPGITVLNDFFIKEYLTDEKGSIAGAFGIDIKTGGFILIKAKAIIDATGGPLNLFKVNTGTPESTGDGIAMAYRLGAELVDMEFVQFYPIGLYQPPALFGDEAIPAMTRLWLRGHLYNAMGERFMTRYDSKNMEMADRDVLSTAVWQEIKEGRGLDDGGVWLDTSYHADQIIEKVIAEQAPGWKMRGYNLLEMGLDLRKNALVVGPLVHFFCGGIKVVDQRWATDIPGLFASGECVGGVHGANRLPGGALTETQVSGARAGKYAAEYAREQGFKSYSQSKVADIRKKVEQVALRDKGVRAIKILRELQDLMWMDVGLLRNKQGLERSIARIEEMRHEKLKSVCPGIRGKLFNQEWMEALELENALLVAEAIAKAAARRMESRGNHQREDYPETKEEWVKNIYISSQKGQMTLATRNVITL